MGQRLLVNDQLTAIPGTRTFWHDLVEWFGCEFVGGDYSTLVEKIDTASKPFLDISLGVQYGPSLIIRNGSYFGPLKSSASIPTISILQDIFESGPQRETQESVIQSSRSIVFNSLYTHEQYVGMGDAQLAFRSQLSALIRIIPLPVDFTLFEPGNALGLQQAHSLPDGCVCWIGAQSEIKGYDIFLSIVRQNPDIHFVAVFKDAPPAYGPPNLRIYSRLPHERLVEVIGACRVGLCTSRTESQHLAGIEMGACGLPMVAPPVGCYWERTDMPGMLVGEPSVASYTSAIRASLNNPGDPQATRSYWEREFSKSVIREAWTKLVERVENV